MKILLVAGARPNFMKIAPLVRALTARRPGPCHGEFSWKIVHTGQHYDYEMSQAFFEDLELPRPDFFLNAGSGSHASQTARIMTAFEEVCLAERPDLVVVVGDVNSTLACSITAKKLLIRVAHVEAGLRSFDMAMPEEINRMVTDSISDFLFVTEESAVRNLLREGKPRESIHFVGHVMIDNLFHQLGRLEREDPARLSTYPLKKELHRYVFLTLHRPSNVDSPETFSGIVDALNEIAAETPILFPVHPRTRKMMGEFGVRLHPGVRLLDPLGFTESLFLWKDAAVVITDSGGLQEETTALGVPCITVRENTERPITVEMGTNTVAGNRKEAILRAYRDLGTKTPAKRRVPPLWDGMAAERIVDILLRAPR
ncbi:MAG: UDP-N-acetylglucosamine 2-epimerase (non-hydrolyzing) [Thermodesulfobacteriota bacterium]